MHLGATPFSVYNTCPPEQIEYPVSEAETRIVVTEKVYLDTVLDVKGRCASVEQVIVVDEPAEGTLSLDEVEAGGRDDFDFEGAWRAVEPDDVLTLIYTSGTTGPPKGVQITHRNVMTASRSADPIIKFPPETRVVSYLPVAHTAERTVS